METWRRYFQKSTALCLCGVLLAGCVTCGLTAVPAAAAPLDWEESDAPTEEPDALPEEPETPPEPDVPPEEPDIPTQEPDAPPEDPDIPTQEPDAPPEEPDIPTEEPGVPPEEPDISTEEPAIPPEEPDIPPGEPEKMPEFVDPPALLTVGLGQPYEYLEIDSGGSITGIKEGFDDALLIAGGYFEIPGEIDEASVTGIGGYVFSGNPNIKSLKIPDIALSQGAFAGCGELSKVIFSGEPGRPDGLFVHMSAFSGCIALFSITISCNKIEPLGRPFINLPIEEVIITTNVAAENWQSFDFRAGTLTAVTFTNNVTALPANAFTACPADSAVELPAGLTMDPGAFDGAAFTKLILNDLSANFAMLPASVTEITFNGDVADYDNNNAAIAALNGASNLETLNLNLNSFDLFSDFTVQWQGSGPASTYSYLQEVNFIGNYDTIQGFIFSNCTGLERITLPEGLKIIDSAAFYNTGLKEINFPSSLETIGESSFESTKIETLDISHTQVQSINDYAFRCCPALKSVKMPSTLLTLGGAAFEQCSNLESVEFAVGSPLVISSLAFSEATRLKSVALPSTLMSVAFDTADAFFDTVFTNNPETASLTVVFPPDIPGSGLISEWNTFYDKFESTLAAQIDFSRLAALKIQVGGAEVDLTGTALQLVDLTGKYAAAGYLPSPEDLWAHLYNDPQTPERPRGVVSASPVLHPGGLMEFLTCPELQSAYASLPAETRAELSGLADRLLDAMESPVQAAADSVTVRCVTAQTLRGDAWLGAEWGVTPPRIRRSGRRRG